MRPTYDVCGAYDDPEQPDRVFVGIGIGIVFALIVAVWVSILHCDLPRFLEQQHKLGYPPQVVE
jgi:hypothetical protein